ncbi:MAG: cysteine-rich CWC family protein [Burkholderiaceae bacterium]|nr:cysteine-rich CWC family protein [Burkholderiaceae bacterium]
MDETAAKASRCARCGASFRCGIDDSAGCWCARLPAAPLDRLDAGAGCLCPDCLAAVVGSGVGTPMTT